MEANKFGEYGGIWRAPKSYSFLAQNKNQTDVQLIEKFGNWVYTDRGIEKRMPWISEVVCPKVHLTVAECSIRCFGSIVSSQLYDDNYGLPAPWIASNLKHWPGTIWYWMREGLL